MTYKSQAHKFKEEFPEAYWQSFDKTLNDFLNPTHTRHESFRHLRMRDCKLCCQQSAFFYGDKCWRCFYANEFYLQYKLNTEHNIEHNTEVRTYSHESIDDVVSSFGNITIK